MTVPTIRPRRTAAAGSMSCQRPGFERWLLARCFLSIVVVFLLIGVGTAEAAPKDDEATRLVKSLEQENPDELFDEHGNVHGRLQRLMVLRFDATPAVEAGIDRLKRNSRQVKLIAALYRVLGFVKDPASAPWLEAKLRSPERQSVHDHYMQNWQDGIGFGFGNNQGFGGWPWLTGRDRWIAFFIAAHNGEPSSDRRVELMNVLKGFDDPPAKQFFLASRKTVSDPREILLIEAYLHQHDLPVDGKRITLAIRALARGPRNRDLLIGTADALRHEAFVPYLISTLGVTEGNVAPRDHYSQEVLEDITFELDSHDRKSWNDWYSKHRGETRDQWVQAAIESFRKRLLRDPEGAKQLFAKKASNRWNDIVILPFIRFELLPRAEFRSEIAGWINMTYTEFYRPRLKPVADALARHPQQLEDWARQLLMEHSFIPLPRPDTWEDYVQWSNRRM
jgi:hypothetical protein